MEIHCMNNGLFYMKCLWHWSGTQGNSHAALWETRDCSYDCQRVNITTPLHWQFRKKTDTEVLWACGSDRNGKGEFIL